MWSRSTLVAILSLIRVYTIWQSQQSHQGLYYFPFIFSSIIKVYTDCRSQKIDQGLHCLPFSAIRSASTMFAILSSLIRSTLFVFLSLISVYTICHSQEVWSGATLFVILSSQFQQGLHFLPFSVWAGSTLFAILKSDRGLHYVLFLTVWSGSLLFVIISTQYNQSLHCSPFSALWAGSTQFVILSLIRVYTICHTFLAVSSRFTLFAILSSVIGSILFVILSSLIRVFTICISQPSYHGLHYFPFFLNSIIKAYTAYPSF